MENYYRDNVRLPLDEAHTMNPNLYADATVYDIEKKAIWEATWVCVGTTTEYEKNSAGTAKVGDHSILLTRAKDGLMRAFENVCRHRGNQLHPDSEPICAKKTVVCKYHRWCYSLDGRLLAAPLMTSSEGGKKAEKRIAEIEAQIRDTGLTEEEISALDKEKLLKPSAIASCIAKKFDKAEYSLFPIRCETLGHMIFVNIDGNAPPLNEYLGCVPKQIQEHCEILRDETQVFLAGSKTYDSKCNWKLLSENFMEYYHLPSVHPSLTLVSSVDNHVRTQGPGYNTSFVTSPLTSGGTPLDPGAAPHFPNLSAYNNQTAWFHYIFPNVFYFCLPHSFFMVRLDPQSPEHTIEHATLVMHKSTLDMEGYEGKVRDIFNFYDETNLEDIEICESVQRGVKATGYKGGRFSFRFEETIHRFQNMYADLMIGLRRIPEGDETKLPGSGYSCS